MSGHGLCLSLALLSLTSGAASEYSTKTDSDYEFGDYRGKWCMDDYGFVYNIGETYYPSPTSCPCTCTEDGPLCIQPQCPRIHPRCTRISYKSCCPVCEAVSKVCVHGGKTYKVLEEFMVRVNADLMGKKGMSSSRTPTAESGSTAVGQSVVTRKSRGRTRGRRTARLTLSRASGRPPHQLPVCQLSPCEKCRCEANREVYCTVSEWPNCFAGSQVIPAGVRVDVDEYTVCFCSYKDGTWETHHQATCERRKRPDQPEEPGGTSEQMVEEQLTPELDTI
ncbi:hypothetical protein JZ751_013125, partial [Albula glossodonta]